jgi:hypothetical protein
MIIFLFGRKNFTGGRWSSTILIIPFSEIGIVILISIIKAIGKYLINYTVANPIWNGKNGDSF